MQAVLSYYVDELFQDYKHVSYRDFSSQYETQKVYTDPKGEAEQFMNCLREAKESNLPILLIKPHLISIEPVIESKLLEDSIIKFILPEIDQTVDAEILITICRYQEYLAQSKKPLPISPLSIEFGFDIIGVAKSSIERIRLIRGELLNQFGFAIPRVRILDNLKLDSKMYRIFIRENEVANFSLYPDKRLAINIGGAEKLSFGLETIEPSFGLEAFWIEPERVEEAEALHYIIVRPVDVLGTHLTEILRKHMAEIFDLSCFHEYLWQLQATQPHIYSEIASIDRVHLLSVLQNLLSEHLSIHDSQAIIQSILKNQFQTRSPHLLTELVRQSFGRTITGNSISENGKVYCVTFDDDLNEILSSGLKTPKTGCMSLNISPQIKDALLGNIQQAIQVIGSSRPDVYLGILCPFGVRGVLKRWIQPLLSFETPFITKEELVAGTPIEVLATLSANTIQWRLNESDS